MANAGNNGDMYSAVSLVPHGKAKKEIMKLNSCGNIIAESEIKNR